MTDNSKLNDLLNNDSNNTAECLRHQQLRRPSQPQSILKDAGHQCRFQAIISGKMGKSPGSDSGAKAVKFIENQITGDSHN